MSVQTSKNVRVRESRRESMYTDVKLAFPLSTYKYQISTAM